MWSDPSKEVDLVFLSRIPALDLLAVQLYPIDSKLLNNLMKQATSNGDIEAALGASLIWFAKNNCQNLKKEFPVMYLQIMDKLFFLISVQRKGTFKLEISLLWLIRLNIKKALSEFDKTRLKKYLQKLKDFKNVYMKTFFYVTDKYNQRQKFVKQGLEIFVFDQQDKSNINYYARKFNEHGLYISKNKKHLQLLKALLQIEYCTIEEINKLEYKNQKQEYFNYILTVIRSILRSIRPSVSIQIMAFILMKLFLMYPQMTKDHYEEIMPGIVQIIDKNQISKINLEEMTPVFAYHMKNNHYFYYIEYLFDPAIKHQYQLISEWKHKIRTAIDEHISVDQQKIGIDQIQQTIFYLQMRNKAEFLWNTSQYVNHFPEIESKVLRRVMRNGIFKDFTTAQDFLFRLVMKFSLKSLQQMKQIYDSLNIIEKAIFFYYMNNFQAGFSLPSRLQQDNKEQVMLLLQNFTRSLSNAQILQLLDFYINEIELGNYYNVQKSGKCMQNSVNQNLYGVLIQNVYLRLMNSLSQYKKLSSTQDLTYLIQFHKYLLLMIKGICPKEFKTPFICTRCKIASQNDICCRCKSICLGLKLSLNRNIFNPGQDIYFYQDKLNNMRNKIAQVENKVYQDMNICSNQWLNMLDYVLQSLFCL